MARISLKPPSQPFMNVHDVNLIKTPKINAAILDYSEWPPFWINWSSHPGDTTVVILVYSSWHSSKRMSKFKCRFRFLRHCGAVSVDKWNTKIWYQTSWLIRAELVTLIRDKLPLCKDCESDVFAERRTATARNISLVIFAPWQFDPYKLAWKQKLILVRIQT